MKTTTLEKWVRPPCYRGATWEGYLVAPITRNRDSSALENTNWESQWDILKDLQKDVPGEDEHSPIVVSENHWAVGWVEWVAIHESNVEAIEAAEKIAERLERYPVLNDELLSQREMEEANEVWQRCYNEKERIAYIRGHRSQFEFRSFSEMLDVVRGKYFIGYASELIN
jgi:hypothetical protein